MATKQKTTNPLAGEHLIRLSEVRELEFLRGRSDGGRISLATLYRWATKGYRGEKLETTRIVGTVWTTEGAVRRFLERVNGGEQ